MLKLTINHNLRCEVDYKKSDCNREPPHCHITRNGNRIAQVWLNPVLFQAGYDLDRNEENLVLSFVESHRSELESEYNDNKYNGADY